jgi:hypothetical protein
VCDGNEVASLSLAFGIFVCFLFFYFFIFYFFIYFFSPPRILVSRAGLVMQPWLVDHRLASYFVPLYNYTAAPTANHSLFVA